MFKGIIEKIKKYYNDAKAKKENSSEKYVDMQDKIEKAKNDYLDETVSKNGSRADLSRFSDKEIKEIAGRILAEDYDAEKASVQNKLDDTLDKYSEKKAKAQSDYEQKSVQTQRKGEEDKKELKEDFMEKGTARSSAAKLKEKEVEEQNEKDLKALSDYKESVEAIANDRMAKAKEQAEKQNEYAKTRYENDLSVQFEKLLNLAGTKYGDSLTDKQKAEEYSSKIVNYVGEYLKGLSQEEIKDVLENDLYLKSVTTEKERKYLKGLYLK